MTQTLFANNASTTIGSAIAPTDTTITVATGTGASFPAIISGQSFTATLWAAGSTAGLPNEIVRVTARVGDTMTVIRGQEGTTAQSWGVGDTFANYPTAGFYNALLSAANVQLQSGNSAVDTGTANAGVITLNPAITSMADILYAPIRVLKVNTDNTGAYTLNVNGLGNKAVRVNANALQAGNLRAATVFEVVWDGTVFELISTPWLTYNNALAQMAASSIKGNLLGTVGGPSDVPLSALASALNVPVIGPYSVANNGYYYLPGNMLVQWGKYRFTTNSVAVVYDVFYNVNFSGPAFGIATFRYAPVTRTYNQKSQIMYGDGTNSKFSYFICDNDSGDGGSYSYGFDWIAVGPA